MFHLMKDDKDAMFMTGLVGGNGHIHVYVQHLVHDPILVNNGNGVTLDLVVEPEPDLSLRGIVLVMGNLLMRMEMTSIMVMMILMVISTSMRVMRMIGMIGVGMILILTLKYLDAKDLVRNRLLRNHKGMGLSPLIVMRVLVILKWKGLEK